MKNFFIINLLIINFFKICAFEHYATSISKNKIVYLISPPRSLSVAMLRYFEARGDFAILHEPSQRACNELHKTNFISLFSEDAPRTHEEVAKKLFETQPDTNLFIKEMSFATIDLITQHPELLRNPNIHFVFLIRNPHHTIISLYRKQSSASLTDFDWVIGYEPCYTLLEMAKTESPNQPIIVRSEDLYTNPQGYIISPTI